MMKIRQLILALATVGSLTLAPGVQAADSAHHASTAVTHSGQAVIHGSVAGATAVSAVVAVPLLAVGAVGGLSTAAGNELVHAAGLNSDDALPVSDENYIATPPPDQAITNGGMPR